MSTTIISLTLYKQNQRKIRFTFVIIVDKSDKFFFPFTTFHRCRLRASVQKLESHSEMKLFPQTLKNLFGCLCCLTKTVFCSVFHAGFHVCTENFPHEKKEPTHNRKRKKRVISRVRYLSIALLLAFPLSTEIREGCERMNSLNVKRTNMIINTSLKTLFAYMYLCKRIKSIKHMSKGEIFH